MPIDQVRRQFETNVFGLIRMCQLVLPGMREQRWGKIVNIGSMGGRLTFPGGGLYHATKYAVEAISDALRFEVRGFGVDVILIEPGLIVTNFGEVAVGVGRRGRRRRAYADFNRKVAKLTEGVYKGPMAKLGGGPEAVAKTIAGALSQAARRPRYPVTPSAHLLINQRRLVPDQVWDLMMRTQFPTPGPSAISRSDSSQQLAQLGASPRPRRRSPSSSAPNGPLATASSARRRRARRRCPAACRRSRSSARGDAGARRVRPGAGRSRAARRGPRRRSRTRPARSRSTRRCPARASFSRATGS